MLSRRHDTSEEALSSRLQQMVRDHLDELDEINPALTEADHAARMIRCLDLIGRAFDVVAEHEAILATARRRARRARPLTDEQVKAQLDELLAELASRAVANDEQCPAGGNRPGYAQTEHTGSREKKDGDK